jgi:hypothetical protein
VTHDHDGDWQFLCGQTHQDSLPKLVCIGCMLERDPTLWTLATCQPGGALIARISTTPGIGRPTRSPWMTRGVPLEFTFELRRYRGDVIEGYQLHSGPPFLLDIRRLRE